MLRCVLFLIYISDKSQLRQYLKDGYKEKLDVTLLPDWEQLHVSQIFSPPNLVCDGAKQNKEEENYRKLGTYRDLFYNNDVLQKRVVLLGEAGAGKTTFSKHLTSVWCESSTLPQFSVLKQFHYFFYVSCRFANKKDSILDMITHQLFDDEKMLKVAIHVLKNHPEDCFILIDGADELKGSPTLETGKRGDIDGLPSMAGVDGSVILITSRPWRFYALSKKTQDIFMRIKINGIKDIGELTYRILEQLEDPDPRQSSSEFLHQVSEKDMDELMKIPLILLIALGSWVDDHSLHKSMCINYINMLQTFIRRSKGQGDWSSSINKLGRLIPNLNDIENKWELQSNELPGLLSKYNTIQRHAGLFLFLGHLAFDLLLRKNEQSLVFSKAEFKSYLRVDEDNNESLNVCLALGILSKAESKMRGLKKMESFAFCHKTFQEFFAALWLASKYENEKSKLYKCIKNVDDLFDYEMLIIFLCGIDPMAGKQLWLDLAENVEIPDWRVKKVHELVCKCMKQQEINPIDQASDQIYFCIANLYIRKYTSDEDVMLLRHVSEEYSCNVKSLHVVGENNVFGEKSVLRESLYRIMQHISSLRLFHITITHHDSEQLLGSLSSCSCLEKLCLDKVKCSEQSHSCCLPVLDLQQHNKLEELYLEDLSVNGLLLPLERDRFTSLWLYNVTMNHHDLEQLLGSLSSCSCLENLYLREVKCSEQSHSCCLPVLDLQQHNKLWKLDLLFLSVNGLLLPVERDRFTSLWLYNVTMNHHDLEQLLGSLSSCSCLENLYLREVKCSEQSHSCCLPVLDLQQNNMLQELGLLNLSVKGLLLPVERDRFTTLSLDNVTINHQHLEQLPGSLSSYSGLEKLYLDKVKCSEQSHSCCLPVLDLQKHNKLQDLDLKDLSVEGLLLPVERDMFTSLWLYNVTMNHQYLEQLSGSLSSYSGLEELYLSKVKCSEQSHSCCLPVLDLQKHNKLKELKLLYLSVKGLLLPVERDRFTSLTLINVTMNHQYLEQLLESLSSYSYLEYLYLYEVKCHEQSHICSLPVLDLEQHNKLHELELCDLSVEGLLLPVERDRLTTLWLDNVTMNHQYLEQLLGSLSSYSGLEYLYLNEVKCSEQSHSCCLPVLDLQKHNKLEELNLLNLSVEGLLLPVERDMLTSLSLDNVTMNHQYLEQLSGSLSSYSGLEYLYLNEVKCSEQSHSCCLPVLDLQKHNKLEELNLLNLSVEGLLLPVERDMLTSLSLDNVTMNHQYLEQLSGSLSSYSCLVRLYLNRVKCNEQSHSCCLPVLDLQKHNKLEELTLWDLSVKGLLLPVERDRLKSLWLINVTMNHQYLEQLLGSLSSCSCLEKLYLVEVKCSEQSHSCCLPVLDLQKHSKLEELRLWNLSVKGLLLPVEKNRFTSLWLSNVTMNHQYLEQLLGSLSSCSCLEELYLYEVKCSEQSHSCCLPVLDLQQHNKLHTLYLRDFSVKGLLLPVERDTLTLLLLTNVTMNHQYLEQLLGSLSSYSCLGNLKLLKVKCSEQSHSCSLPVLDLQKHNTLWGLYLSNLSVKGLHVERDRLTSLRLLNVTMKHHDLEQLSGSLSSCSCLEILYLYEVKCNEHSHSCCLPVLDLQKHNKLKELRLWNLYVKGLLLPVERDRLTLLNLANVTMNHHGLKQLAGSLSSYSSKPSDRILRIRCSEHSPTSCQPVIDMYNLMWE